MRRGAETIKSMEGENDFSGKRWVWLADPTTAFMKGWVVEELENNELLVQCDDGSVSWTGISDVATLTNVLATNSTRRQH